MIDIHTSIIIMPACIPTLNTDSAMFRRILSDAETTRYEGH